MHIVIHTVLYTVLYIVGGNSVQTSQLSAVKGTHKYYSLVVVTCYRPEIVAYRGESEKRDFFRKTHYYIVNYDFKKK